MKRRLSVFVFLLVVTTLLLVGGAAAQTQCDTADALFKAKLYDAALTNYTAVLQQYPNFTCALNGINESQRALAINFYNLGRAYENAGQIDLARTAYENALQKNQTFTEAQLALKYLPGGAAAQMQCDTADALFKAKLYDAALTNYTARLQQYPNLTCALNGISESQRALAINFYELGLAYEKANLVEAAKAAYSGALKIDPNFSNAAEALARLNTGILTLAYTLYMVLLPYLEFGVVFGVVIAVFAVFGLVVYALNFKIRPWICGFYYPSLDILEFDKGATGLEIGKGLKAMVGASYNQLVSESPRRSVNLVDGPTEKIAIPADEKVAPYFKFVSDLIDWLFPPHVIRLSGSLQKPGSRGAGITVTLVDNKTKKILDSYTIWQNDIDLETTPKKTEETTPKKTEEPIDPTSYYNLAEPAAIWVFFKLKNYFKQDFQSGNRSEKKEFTMMGTNDWKSYAYFKAGVRWQLERNLVKAQQLYVESLSIDMQNMGTLYNLGRMEMEDGQYQHAFERLNMAKEKSISDEAHKPEKSKDFLRNPIWYRASYNLALIYCYLNKRYESNLTKAAKETETLKETIKKSVDARQKKDKEVIECNLSTFEDEAKTLLELIQKANDDLQIAEKISKLTAGETTYLFSWDDIPGNDNWRLIEFLKKRLDVEWAENANINKIDYGRTIRLSFKNNFLSLKLNDEKTKVSLKIDDGRTDEFIARAENGKLKIYETTNDIKVRIKKSVDTIRGPLKEIPKNEKKVDLLNKVEEIEKAINELQIAEKISKLTAGETTHLFSWDDIPGNDNERLIEFLTQKFGIVWLRGPKFEKEEDTITASAAYIKNCISLRLDNENAMVNLEIGDGRTDEFVAKAENGKLNIYVETTNDIKVRIEKSVDTIRRSLKEIPKNEKKVDLSNKVEEITKAIEKLLKNKDAPFVFIMSKAEEEAKNLVYRIKKAIGLPMTEQEAKEQADNLVDAIKKAIGLSMTEQEAKNFADMIQEAIYTQGKNEDKYTFKAKEQENISMDAIMKKICPRQKNDEKELKEFLKSFYPMARIMYADTLLYVHGGEKIKETNAIINGIEYSSLTYRGKYNMACYYSIVGEKSKEDDKRNAYSESLCHLEYALERGGNIVNWANKDPDLDGVREDKETKEDFAKLIKKYAPQEIPLSADMPLADIAIIGKAYAKQLKENEIVSYCDLILKADTPSSREELAKKLGVSTQLLTRWALLADLMRIVGTAQNTNLLEEAGVKSLKALQNVSDTCELANLLNEINKAMSLVSQTTSPETVRQWVREANKTELKVH